MQDLVGRGPTRVVDATFTQYKRNVMRSSDDEKLTKSSFIILISQSELPIGVNGKNDTYNDQITILAHPVTELGEYLMIIINYSSEYLQEADFRALYKQPYVFRSNYVTISLIISSRSVRELSNFSTKPWSSKSD